MCFVSSVCFSSFSSACFSSFSSFISGITISGAWIEFCIGDVWILGCFLDSSFGNEILLSLCDTDFAVEIDVFDFDKNGLTNASFGKDALRIIISSSFSSSFSSSITLFSFTSSSI